MKTQVIHVVERLDYVFIHLHNCGGSTLTLGFNFHFNYVCTKMSIWGWYVSDSMKYQWIIIADSSRASNKRKGHSPQSVGNHRVKTVLEKEWMLYWTIIQSSLGLELDCLDAFFNTLLYHPPILLQPWDISYVSELSKCLNDIYVKTQKINLRTI